jgi:muconolactone delta-isomerase
MEYLVTMTTQVPEGTSDEMVEETRSREAARSRELAAEGHLLRLWRPPLQPGEWRSIGLFAAADEDELEKVLASMPLRVWRSDDVAPLSAHPNDPPHSDASKAREFLTTFTVTLPSDADPVEVENIKAGEAQRTRELAKQGHLLRLWMLPPTPGSWHALGLWHATDAQELQATLTSLPMDKWMTTEATALTEHPNDPATSGARKAGHAGDGPGTDRGSALARPGHSARDAEPQGDVGQAARYHP